VALRAWLAKHGLSTTLEGGGDVQIVPQANAQTLETFRSGGIAGAWVPEPWATRLVLEGGGKVLVDEADLWPAGEFVTTHLIVRTAYLRAHRAVVEHLLAGHLAATEFVNADGATAKQVVNAAIKSLTGKALRTAVIDRAWSNLRFTIDPIASSLGKSAADAIANGLLDPVDLKGIYELSPLNRLLRDANLKEVLGL
jgi:NitT/TauT family transport system substrate-binding protein